MKNAAYDYKSVDDNIQYLNMWGAKQQLVVIIKRITNYTQGLYLETTDRDFYSQNNQQVLQGRATGVDDAVQWGLRQINHHKRKFF